MGVVKLHGLLSFYDEPETSLLACIDGLANAGVDHLLAVDGAYQLYPDAKAADGQYVGFLVSNKSSEPLAIASVLVDKPAVP